MEKEDTLCKIKEEYETGKQRERPISEIMEESMALCWQTELQAEMRDDKGETRQTSRQAEKRFGTQGETQCPCHKDCDKTAPFFAPPSLPLILLVLKVVWRL
jgi:hypothetical protein